MKNDWRLTNQLGYLFRAKLHRKTFKRTEQNDHEHCEFCMDKFGEEPGLLHTGYCTEDEYRWVCDQCFYDFKGLFEWEVN